MKEILLQYIQLICAGQTKLNLNFDFIKKKNALNDNF